VGVPVQKKIAPCRRHFRRNVLEMKTVAGEFEVQRERPCHALVAIPAHHPQLCRHGLQLFQQRWLADIAEVPDFISASDRLGDMVGQAIVCVGDNRYGYLIFDCGIFDWPRGRFISEIEFLRWGRYRAKPGQSKMGATRLIENPAIENRNSVTFR
jgi:hypothetical protein